MNNRIVAGINNVIRYNDILFHLGDWSFGGFDSITEFRNRIDCKNIHLILGNHDHHIERNKEDIRDIFSSVHQYLELNVNKEYNFVLMHYPIMSWNNMNDSTIHLHGHVHLPPNRRIGKGKMMDVGVDGNGMDPISLTKVLTLMNPQPIKSGFEFDHHVKRVQ
jgi:calcineurin-like phosphoesterase family protein